MPGSMPVMGRPVRVSRPGNAHRPVLCAGRHARRRHVEQWHHPDAAVRSDRARETDQRDSSATKSTISCSPRATGAGTSTLGLRNGCPTGITHGPAGRLRGRERCRTRGGGARRAPQAELRRRSQHLARGRCPQPAPGSALLPQDDRDPERPRPGEGGSVRHGGRRVRSVGKRKGRRRRRNLGHDVPPRAAALPHSPTASRFRSPPATTSSPRASSPPSSLPSPKASRSS